MRMPDIETPTVTVAGQIVRDPFHRLVRYAQQCPKTLLGTTLARLAIRTASQRMTSPALV
jgi:hypothetical protein